MLNEELHRSHAYYKPQSHHRLPKHHAHTHRVAGGAEGIGPDPGKMSQVVVRLNVEG